MSAEQNKDDLRQLQETLERYRLAIEGSTHGLYDWLIDEKKWDNPESHVWYSSRFNEILGYSKEGDLPEKLDSLLARIHEEDKKKVLKAIEEHLDNGRTLDLECRLKMKSGNFAWFRVRGKAFKDKNGKRLAGSLVDISERKKSQSEVLVAEDKYRTVFENSAVAITVTDENEKIISWNKYAELMLGMGPKDLQDKPVKELYPPEEWERLQSLDLRKKGMLHHFETKIIKKDGSLLDIDISVTILRTEEGGKTGSIGVIRDITERKENEDSLKKASEAAYEANRAKSEFLANMSHEIRTPMNGVIGMTNLLLETALNNEQQEYVMGVRKSAESLLTLVNDILDFSKIEAGKLVIEVVEFDLRNAVEEIADMIAIKAEEKNIELIVRYDPKAPRRVKGDPGRIRQVITNLVSNSVKFTEQGFVMIDVDCREEKDGRCLLHFSVEDSGVGIPRDQLGNIFDKFIQADISVTRKHGGTGLGLAICKQLVTLMEGKIGAESDEGKGSTFWFDLDLALGDPPGRILPKADLKKVKVLVVDDNEMNAEVLREQMQAWGIDAHAVSSGAEGLAALHTAAKEGAAYDIAILDFQLPGMNGQVIAQAIKADPSIKNTVLVLLTSVGIRGDAKRFQEVGFAAYLVKPAREKDLMEALSVIWAAKQEGRDIQIVTRHTMKESEKYEQEARPKSGLDKIFVLLAEDNVVNQQVAKRMLEKLNCDVDIAYNGFEAVEKTKKNNYDIIFMDCQMPEMDGYQATDEIRKFQGDKLRTPIIAVTANAMVGDREKCLNAGMDDYLSKPIKKDLLDEVLSRWLKKEKQAMRKEKPSSPSEEEISEPKSRVPQPEVKPKEEVREPAKPQSSQPAEKPVQEDFEGQSINPKRLDYLREFADEGDDSFILTLFETYFKSASERIQNIAASVEESDAYRLGREAHGLKGSSGNVGAEKMMTISKKLEEIGKEGSLNGADALLEAMKSEFERVKQEFNENIREKLKVK